MPPTSIQTLEALHQHLHLAMQLEHAMIPPYILALYSIYPGTNTEASHILRSIVTEKMLHLALVANVLNATGGRPNLAAPDFVPRYPIALPSSGEVVEVNLQHFSKDAIDSLLKSECSYEASSERNLPQIGTNRTLINQHSQFQYSSIAQFYKAIRHGLNTLASTLGARLFTGNSANQATEEYYYSGGGTLLAVTDLDSALEALNQISIPNAERTGGLYTKEHELTHYNRLDQLRFGRFYQEGNQQGQPGGPSLTVDWNAVYPIQKNPRLREYDSAIYADAAAFNQSYAEFLALLTRAFNGEPQLLLDAVPRMFKMRTDISRLIRTPLPTGRGVNAAPTFELSEGY